MKVYLESFNLIAPFDNDVIQTIGSPFDYWRKYGFNTLHLSTLADNVGCQMKGLIKRGHVSEQLGSHTLSDFKSSRRIGDTNDVYVFSVISSEKEIAEKTVSDVFAIYKEFIDKKKVESEIYSLESINTAIFNLAHSHFPGEKKEKEYWENLITDIPYVDKVYDWLLCNRFYPEVRAN